MIRVRPIESGDQYWVVRRLEDAFGGVTVARKGVLIDASVLPGFLATDGGRPVGLLTYDVAHDECEVVAIISTQRGRGIGRALMDAVRYHAVAAGCRRLWLVTTNDNTRAFRFYQLWGMDLCAYYRHGAHRSRQVKPTLPERGANGLPLDHELEFELLLGGTFRSGVSLGEGTQPRPEASGTLAPSLLENYLVLFTQSPRGGLPGNWVASTDLTRVLVWFEAYKK